MMTAKSRKIISPFLSTFLTSVVAVAMMMHLSGCSTSSSEGESTTSGDETFAEESGGDFKDSGSDELAADDKKTADNSTEQGLGDELSDSTTEKTDSQVADNSNTEKMDDELSLDDEAGLPDDVASNDPKKDEPVPPPPPTDEPVMKDQAEAPPEPPPTEIKDEAPAPVKTFAPLQKIKSSAFKVAGTNLNRVYLARSGDDLKSVASKTLGDATKGKSLVKWNPILNRGVKTGDKIYYPSQANPTDQTMLTYYEDQGIQPLLYVTKDSENIREIASAQLGSKDSWKEIWSTNFEVESKGILPSGTQLRIWPEGAAPTQTVSQAQNDPPAPVDMGQNPMEMPKVDPAPVGGDPLSDPLAQAPTPNPAMGTTTPDLMPSPSNPPPVAEHKDPVAEKPVEPPPVPKEKKAKVAAAEQTEDADNAMMAGLLLIVVLAAGAVIFMVRKNKARKVDLTQTTQIG